MVMIRLFALEVVDKVNVSHRSSSDYSNLSSTFPIGLVSGYLPYQEQVIPFSKVRELETAKQSSVIVGCDANAYNTI